MSEPKIALFPLLPDFPLMHWRGSIDAICAATMLPPELLGITKPREELIAQKQVTDASLSIVPWCEEPK